VSGGGGGGSGGGSSSRSSGSRRSRRRRSRGSREKRVSMWVELAGMGRSVVVGRDWTTVDSAVQMQRGPGCMASRPWNVSAVAEEGIWIELYCDGLRWIVMDCIVLYCIGLSWIELWCWIVLSCIIVAQWLRELRCVRCLMRRCGREEWKMRWMTREDPATAKGEG
jgi:hypothetical protein